MKIERLELFHISIPFRVPYKLSRVYGTLTDAHAVILKIHTDDGLVGYGEADPMNPFTEETPGTVMTVTRDVLAPLLLGQDPRQVAAIESMLDRRVNGNLVARGAVNMALFDILGKSCGLPAHQFLGGARHQSLPLLWPIGSGSPEEDGDALESAIDRGYGTVMIKMGVLPVPQEIRRAKSARERFGDRLAIILDANQGWQVKEAMAFSRGIRGFEPDMVEQPVARFEIEAMAALRRRLDCLLSADEALVTDHDAAALIRAGAVDAFSIKVSKNGGISKAARLATTAQVFGMDCLMNSMLEFGITQAASLQLGCSMENLLPWGHAYMSVLRLSDDITDFGSNISDAVVTVPTAPGLGIAVDDEKIVTYALERLSVTL